jgi:hypothetical protein
MVVTVFSNANPLSGVVACGVENMSEPFWWFRLQLMNYCNMPTCIIFGEKMITVTGLLWAWWDAWNMVNAGEIL